jgi:acylpyruvate hydrolase
MLTTSVVARNKHHDANEGVHGMRFVAFRDSSGTGLAVEHSDGRLTGLHAASAAFPGTLEHLIAGGRSALQTAHGVLKVAPALDPTRIAYLPPLSAPSKIICVGLNYVDHSTETGHKVPTYPTLFARWASSMIGHDAPVVRPNVSTELDYEGEFVAVIGRGGRHIAKSAALDHVIGYSVFNDVSVRDYQMRTPQWTIGKNFDHTGPFGPAFVTADALPAGAAGLRLTTRLNGQVMQSASTNDLIFDVATLVSTISEAMTLAPGDIIVTGTPAGVGGMRKPQVFMKPGDICEVEVEGIGLLRNSIIAETA